jgi:hypothetical protein
VFDDRVGHHHRREEFTELARQVRVVGSEPFQKRLRGSTSFFRQLFEQLRQPLFLRGRQLNIDGTGATGYGSHENPRLAS